MRLGKRSEGLLAAFVRVPPPTFLAKRGLQKAVSDVGQEKGLPKYPVTHIRALKILEKRHGTCLSGLYRAVSFV